jgi:hypothetical protein
MGCYRDGRDSVWFYVPDGVWYAVVGDCQAVLCLTCFDRRAERAGVDYSGDLVVMGRSAWLADGVAAKALEARQAAIRTASERSNADESCNRIVRSA